MGTVENQRGQDMDDSWVRDRRKEFEELIDANHDGIVTMAELQVSVGDVGAGGVPVASEPPARWSRAGGSVGVASRGCSLVTGHLVGPERRPWAPGRPSQHRQLSLPEGGRARPWVWVSRPSGGRWLGTVWLEPAVDAP